MSGIKQLGNCGEPSFVASTCTTVMSTVRHDCLAMPVYSDGYRYIQPSVLEASKARKKNQCSTPHNDPWPALATVFIGRMEPFNILVCLGDALFPSVS